MGGLNHPELATRAGEEALPHSDSENDSEPMETDAFTKTNDHAVDPVRLAGSALSLVGNKAGDIGYQRGSSATESMRPALPRLLTEESPPCTKASRNYSDAASQTVSEEVIAKIPSERRLSSKVADGPSGLGINGAQPRTLRSRSRSPGDKCSATRAFSPVLRRLTVPRAGQKPGDTLPALQPSPPFEIAKPSNFPRGLPSLHDSGLKPLLDGPPPINGYQVQQSICHVSSVLSPPMSSKLDHFPSPQTRSTSTFSAAFPHGQPSPAYSNASPQNTANMSPPERPNVTLSSFPPRPQSDTLTPQSADSYTSGFNGAPSPMGEAMDIDRAGRVLPPLVPHPGPPIINGAFKCKYQGCTAPPFQTQYLLK